MSDRKTISFVWTSAALVAGAKTCTRRDWSGDYARSFVLNEAVLAYDRRPERGGIRLALIRIAGFPELQPVADMPDSDYAAEGFQFLSEHPEYWPKTIGGEKCTAANFSWEAFERWRSEGGEEWVIRFSVLEILAPDYLERIRRPVLAPSPLLFPATELREWERGR